MKVIFYDGPTDNLKIIKKEWQRLSDDVVWIIDNSKGYSSSAKKFNKIQNIVSFKNCTVITNSLILLSLLNPNKKSPVYDIYFYNHKQHFVHICDVFPNLSKYSNIVKMYRSGLLSDIERK